MQLHSKQIWLPNPRCWSNWQSFEADCFTVDRVADDPILLTVNTTQCSTENIRPTAQSDVIVQASHWKRFLNELLLVNVPLKETIRTGSGATIIVHHVFGELLFFIALNVILCKIQFIRNQNLSALRQWESRSILLHNGVYLRLLNCWWRVSKILKLTSDPEPTFRTYFSLYYPVLCDKYVTYCSSR